MIQIQKMGMCHKQGHWESYLGFLLDHSGKEPFSFCCGCQIQAWSCWWPSWLAPKWSQHRINAEPRKRNKLWQHGFEQLKLNMSEASGPPKSLLCFSQFELDFCPLHPKESHLKHQWKEITCILLYRFQPQQLTLKEWKSWKASRVDGAQGFMVQRSFALQGLEKFAWSRLTPDVCGLE